MKIKEDLTNRVFGRLIVLERDKSKIGLERGSFWICKCSCGNTKSISRHSLVNHGSESCGCSRKDPNIKRGLPEAQADKNYWIRKYKKRASQLGIDFSLSENDFFEICALPCYYCNAMPTPKSSGYTKNGDHSIFYANGIDRKNPQVGYVSENCLPCCKTCNFMKTNKDFEIFLEHVFNIYKKLNK